jgi:hypothetical protein
LHADGQRSFLSQCASSIFLHFRDEIRSLGDAGVDPKKLPGVDQLNVAGHGAFPENAEVLQLLWGVEVLNLHSHVRYNGAIAGSLFNLKVLRINSNGLRDTSEEMKDALAQLRVSELWIDFQENDEKCRYPNWDHWLYGSAAHSKSALLLGLKTLVIRPESISQLNEAARLVGHCPVLSQLRIFDIPEMSCVRWRLTPNPPSKYPWCFDNI